MKKEEIHLDDWYRILIGQVPPEFYIELVIRTFCVYAIIMFGMKYMGKRIASELNRSELAALATLAAATGLVLLSPERGLISPLVVLGVIYLIRLFVNKKDYSSKRFEEATEGKRSTLISDGEMQWQEMRKARISKESLFAQLRGMGIKHLGVIKRFYMEANGSFSLTKEPAPKPGLPAIPDWDTAFLQEQTRCLEWQVCANCGHRQQPAEISCPVCNNKEWIFPITETEEE
jgi:uncharacterized membrane protein YcaP (DUF421 family)